MITQLAYIAASLAVTAACVRRLFQVARGDVQRETVARTDSLVDRARTARDVAQHWGRLGLTAFAGVWAVLVALSCALTIATGRY